MNIGEPLSSSNPHDNIQIVYNEFQPLPGELVPAKLGNVNPYFPDRSRDFYAFVRRSNLPVLAFFVNSEDPTMRMVLENLKSYLSCVSVVVVDVKKMPDLGVRFQVTRPVFIKFASGIAQRYFMGNVLDKRAVHEFINSLSNWRVQYSGVHTR